ncbi:MAG: HPr(Ser) kinase/phosphatase [Bacillota bacterium]
MQLKREEKEEVRVMPAKFAEACNLEIIFDTNVEIPFMTYGISRPGLILSGHGNYFASTRVQVLGINELNYINHLTSEERYKAVNNFMEKHIPCVIISRKQSVPCELIASAKANNIPIFRSKDITSIVVAEVAKYLMDLLAPHTSAHGILMDIHGTGVLFTGDSGIGKSETALELIHRGHRLVSDDVVDMKLIQDKIYGTSPVITKNLMEIRGVGIVDISAIYGAGAVVPRKIIEVVVSLEKWQEDKAYDRVTGGIEMVDILGVKVPKYTIPVTTGRNIAMIAEIAVKQFRLKQSGHDTIALLTERMNESKD